MLDEAGVDVAQGHLRLDGEYNIKDGEVFAVLNASGITDFALEGFKEDTVDLDGLLAINGQTGVKGETNLTVAGNMERLGWRDLQMSDVDFEALVGSGKAAKIEKFAAFAGDGGALNLTGSVMFDGSFSGSGKMVNSRWTASLTAVWAKRQRHGRPVCRVQLFYSASRNCRPLFPSSAVCGSVDLLPMRSS